MIRLILQHWAFQSYVAWVLIVSVVILLGKGHVGALVKWRRKQRLDVAASRLNAAATFPLQDAVKDSRIRAVKNSSPSGREKEANDLTDYLHEAAAEEAAHSRRCG